MHLWKDWVWGNERRVQLWLGGKIKSAITVKTGILAPLWQLWGEEREDKETWESQVARKRKKHQTKPHHSFSWESVANKNGRWNGFTEKGDPCVIVALGFFEAQVEMQQRGGWIIDSSRMQLQQKVSHIFCSFCWILTINFNYISVYSIVVKIPMFVRLFCYFQVLIFFIFLSMC